MDILGLITNAVSGGVGGNVAGVAVKDQSLGAMGNSIAGAVGGVAGAWILQAMGVLNSLGLADMNLASISGDVATSAMSGGVITAIIGAIKNKFSGS